MGNLMFHPKSIADYTITLVTTTESGHPKENMQDFRLDTYWRGTSTATHYIQIDAGAAIAVDSFCLHHALNISAIIDLYGASQSDYSDEAVVASTEVFGSGEIPILAYTFTAATKRYWRFKLTNLSANPRINLIFMGQRQEITIRYKKGPLYEKQYGGGELQESYGGSRFSVNYNPSGRRIILIGWEYLDSTNRTRLQNLLDICKGSVFPFFMRWPVGAGYVFYYVRLMNPGLGAKEIEDVLFNTDMLRFEEEL